MNVFDLIEFQQEARQSKSPDSLFQLWDRVCWHYDRGHIGSYEFDEMKAVIWPHLKSLTMLKHQVEQSFAG